MGAVDLPGDPVSVVDRLAGIFPGETIAFVEQIEEMGFRFDRLPDQRPSTCGAFALSYLLPVLGFPCHYGHDLAAEDYLAHLAGVVVEDWEVGPSREIGERVARGELGEAEARVRYPTQWYRFPVRASSDPTRQGTAPDGIARAVAVGTAGALASVPIAGRTADGDVQLTPERWDRLLDLLHRNVVGWHLHAILNYEANQMLAPQSAEYRPAALRDPRVLNRVPRDTWGVGHFAGLGGLWQRPSGAWWLLLLDTYKARGFDGYQPQPAELMRQALVRDDGRGGGVLLVIPTDAVESLADAVVALGITPAMWDNGSLPPDDWTWELGR